MDIYLPSGWFAGPVGSNRGKKSFGPRGKARWTVVRQWRPARSRNCCDSNQSNSEKEYQVTGENQTAKQLYGVAAHLTSDRELQKDLVQEMLLHLVRVEKDLPGRTVSWYITSCRFHAHHYLKRGRSVDSIKRCRDLVPLGEDHDDGDGGFVRCVDAADPGDAHAEFLMQDFVNLLIVRLTDVQQQILFLLIRGHGVREIGRELSLSHPMISKHRKKIGRVASCLFADSGCVGSRNRLIELRGPDRFVMPETETRQTSPSVSIKRLG